MKAMRLLAALLPSFFLSLPSSAQTQELFQQGVDALSRGNNEEALTAFQKVLAEDPSHQEAFELWQKTNSDIWLKLLTLGGDYELVAKRFMDIARLGRKERRNDEEAIRSAIQELYTDDVSARQRTIYRIGAEFGEYAVPYMVHQLGESADNDRRVITMQALAHMGDDVVLPLIAALEASDPHMRRNVALTLGYIEDPRANGALAWHALSDESELVRSAAAQSLQRCGGTTDVAGQFLALGDAYYGESDTVLLPHQFSDGVWDWEGTKLVFTPIPRFLYAPELAKRAYERALEAAPGSTQALAGVARCAVTQRMRLEQWAALGQDSGDWSERLHADDLAVALAGADAIDLALGWALEQDDAVAATGLAKALSSVATEPTANLALALKSPTASVRGEAAVALGMIASQSTGKIDAAAIEALNEAAGREVLQVAALIDSDPGRRAAFEQALTDRGVLVNAWPNGARGLAALKAVPNVDVVLIGGQLPDLTPYQVIHELRRDLRTQEVPIFVLVSDPETDPSLYGDQINGLLASEADLDQASDAMSAKMSKDREEAAELAARAAETLHLLARSGSGDLRTSADALAGTLAAPRPDSVTAPALGALREIGGPSHVGAIVAFLSDTGRSENVRVLAADALGGIFARSGNADADTVQALRTLATTDASFAVRNAIAKALGRLDLTEEMRAELIRGVHGS